MPSHNKYIKKCIRKSHNLTISPFDCQNCHQQTLSVKKSWKKCQKYATFKSLRYSCVINEYPDQFEKVYLRIRKHHGYRWFTCAMCERVIHSSN